MQAIGLKRVRIQNHVLKELKQGPMKHVRPVPSAHIDHGAVGPTILRVVVGDLHFELP